MWPLRTIFYFLFFWVACFMAIVNPIWGVLNYLVAYQTNPTDTWWGTPLTEIGMRFSMLAALSTMLGLFFGRKYIPRCRPIISLWEVGVVLLVALGALTMMTGYAYDIHTRHAFEKLWKMQLFVLIFVRLTSSRTNVKLVLAALVAGTFYVGYDAYTAPASAFWMGRLERIGGPDFATTSGTGAHLSAMLPLVGVAFLIARSWKVRLFCAACAAFCVNGIVLCRTRSAFIGLAAGATVAILFAPRARRFRIHGLLVIGAFMAFSLTDNHFWDRMSTLTSRTVLEQDAAAMSRRAIWGISLRILADHPMGIGPGNFPGVVGTYDFTYYKRSTHNTLLVCFTEFGVVGGILFLSLIVGSLWLIWSGARLADRTDNPLETRLLLYGTLISLVTYVVTGLGTERFYCESYWWVLALPLCLNRMVLGEVAANEASRVLAPAFAEDDDEAMPELAGLNYG